MSALTQTQTRRSSPHRELVQREVLDFLVFLKNKMTARGEGRENLLPLGPDGWECGLGHSGG